MNPRIEISIEKKCVGKKIIMSFTDNQTRALWQSFMPKRNEIKNAIGSELYSIQVYAPSYFDNFDRGKLFEKWAAKEVTDFDNVPGGMSALVIPGEQYAVFLHKRPPSEGHKTYEYIFREWLPNASYMLDSRPYFELMGDKYKNEDPASEEEIWIPVKLKE